MSIYSLLPFSISCSCLKWREPNSKMLWLCWNDDIHHSQAWLFEKSSVYIWPPVFVIHTFRYLCIVYVLVSSTCFPLFSYKSLLNDLIRCYVIIDLMPCLADCLDQTMGRIIWLLMIYALIDSFAQVSQKEKVEILMEKQQQRWHTQMNETDRLNEWNAKGKNNNEKNNVFSHSLWLKILHNRLLRKFH